jgi:hypothetical protein
MESRRLSREKSAKNAKVNRYCTRIAANAEEPQMNADGLGDEHVKWQIDTLDPDSDRNCGVFKAILRADVLVFASIRVYSRYEISAIERYPLGTPRFG